MYVSLYSPEMFMFVDETGADHRKKLNKYGYSLWGKPPCNHSLLVKERVSTIACMSIQSILDVNFVKGTSNGDMFYEFQHSNLLLHLML